MTQRKSKFYWKALNLNLLLFVIGTLSKNFGRVIESNLALVLRQQFIFATCSAIKKFNKKIDFRRHFNVYRLPANMPNKCLSNDCIQQVLLWTRRRILCRVVTWVLKWQVASESRPSHRFMRHPVGFEAWFDCTLGCTLCVINDSYILCHHHITRISYITQNGEPNPTYYTYAAWKGENIWLLLVGGKGPDSFSQIYLVIL
jgi:hypothetical protein